MYEKTFETSCGIIHYWTNNIKTDVVTLVFLPGLTADHRLFDKQVEYFEDKYNIFVWDAPGHASSWPFDFSFHLSDKAKWLNLIFEKEQITKPIIVGQSMGGYVGQYYCQLYPNKLCGFISIDSAPLQRKFVTAIEIWMLKKVEFIYKIYPWKFLLKSGSKGVAVSEYGRKLMLDMMQVYNNDKKRYVAISGHGYRMLAEAMEANLPYKINCPAMLLFELPLLLFRISCNSRCQDMRQ